MSSQIATIQDIKNHFQNINLDVRKTNDARWIDQKVTPDMLNALAETILSHRKLNPNLPFTMRTIWDDPKFQELMTENFSKPDVDKKSARNEYDKVISQQLLALAYGKIISLNNEKGNQFTLINDKIKILEYIASRERCAYEYLCIYITKVLEDSGLWSSFEKFLDKSSNKKALSTDFAILKNTFENFYKKYTPVQNTDEPRRIFTKVINPLACQRQALGTIKGRLSKRLITYSELLYNRENFRDVGKDKNLTREEYDALLKSAPSFDSEIKKAKNMVRGRHGCSEVLDGSEITTSTEIHHIFMAHERPNLAAHYENLINLSSNQHRNKAHPNSNFNIVDPVYQKICLLHKIHAIEVSEKSQDFFYSRNRFIEVINFGFEEPLLSKDMEYISIKNFLHYFYNQRFNVSKEIGKEI